jgi:hypothetical protein
MAQTGILDYKRYLNTLQTLTNLGQTFPSNQQTYNFAVAGGSTASWPATITWETLILDKVSFSSRETGYIPDVSNSQVIGYYEGGTTTQYSTGVISIPANMYSGPILPGGDFNVPLTVVHLEWFDGVTTYAQQIGFIQNWEPGVEIGDPTSSFDYFAVYGLPSNLTLTGIQGLIYGDDLVLTATTDIPIDLGTNTRVRFYRKDPEGDVLIGTSYFVERTATFTLTTVDNFPIGVYEFYAVSSAYRNYLKATSNDLSVVVAAGVPLIVTTSTFTPDKPYYFIGENVTYNLGVIPDPAFTATGVAISSAVSIKLVNVFSPFTETPVADTNFVNGQTSNPFNVESYMVDLSRADPRTYYEITASTQNSTTYTATLFVSNTETVVSTWDSQFIGRYAAGSTSTSLTVAGTATVTVEGQAFPITITQDSDNTYLDDEFNITVTTPNVAYYNTITIYANKGASTITLYSTNSSGTSTFVAPINATFASTGTWTIYANFPGDLGQSLVNANLPSTSNSLSHFIRDGNTLLPIPKLNFYRNETNDVLQVTASTSTTLTNFVSFYEGTTLLGTAEWVRNTGSVFVTLPGTGIFGKQSGFARNFEVLSNTPSYTARTYTGTIKSIPPYDEFNKNAVWIEENNLTAGGLDQWGLNSGRSAVASEINNTNPISSYGWASPPGELTVNSDIAGGPAYPKTSEVNYWDANPNMAIMNQLEGGFPYPKHPNRFTLFKYYDGSNYNLSAITGTDISAISDPIQFGGWSVTQVERGNNYATPFRWDTIGDSRGYNVIGIETTSSDRPLLGAPEGFTQRLYFPSSVSTSSRYIDLVEFIGTASWQTATLESEVFPGQPTTSTVSVWLYKFTPTIPRPSNRNFKSNYPLYLCDLFSGAYPYNGAVGSLGPNPGIVNQNWLNYGQMQWVSTNTSSAQANDTAAFYNDWFKAFTNPLGTTIEYNRAGYYENSTQTATLILPLNTISTVSNVHAVWTGTQHLPRIYGKYFGFDIYVSKIDTYTSNVEAYRLYTTGTAYTANTLTNNTNALRLKTSVGIVSGLTTTATISGSVQFFSVDTNTVYGTATLTNSVATLDVYAQTLRESNFTSTGPVNIKARYVSSAGEFANSTSTTATNVFVSSRMSGIQYIPFTTATITNLNIGTVSWYSDKNVLSGGQVSLYLPWFAPGTGYGKVYAELFYYRSGDTPGTLTPLPMSVRGIGARDYPSAVNIIGQERLNNGEGPVPLTSGGEFAYVFGIKWGTLFAPASGSPSSGSVTLYANIWSVNAQIPLSSRIGIFNGLNFEYR